MFEDMRTARTLHAQAYPPDLSRRYADLLQEALSGRASALAADHEVPMAQVASSHGLPVGGRYRRILKLATSYRDAPPEEPLPDVYFVPRGFGATGGMSHADHFQWARHLQHPHADFRSSLSVELLQALQFELHSDPEDIDSFRLEVVRRWMDMMRCSRELQHKWLAEIDPRLHSVAQKIAGPMCRMLILDTAFPDKQLADDLEGFPFVDALPQCHFSALASPPKDKGIPFSSDLLRTHRETLNQVVLAGILSSPTLRTF